MVKYIYNFYWQSRLPGRYLDLYSNSVINIFTFDCRNVELDWMIFTVTGWTARVEGGEVGMFLILVLLFDI